MKTTTQSNKHTAWRHVRSTLVLGAGACTTAAALLAVPAAAEAGTIDAQTGQPLLTARQTARLDKLRADTRAVATNEALRTANVPLYRQVVPVRPRWLAPKGKP